MTLKTEGVERKESANPPIGIINKTIKNMNKEETKRWKNGILRFVLFVVVGFLCAFLYRQLKN